MRSARTHFCAALLVLAALAGNGCRLTSAARGPARLRIGTITPVALGAAGPVLRPVPTHFTPFVTYLEQTLGLPVDLEATRDLAGLTADFEAGRFDVAFLGAVDFVQAHERRGAIPLVARESDRSATVVFLASARDPRSTLLAYKGATLSFGPRLSSSHVMGRYYLEQEGITPEQFFGEVRHSANSDDTALLVSRGEVELAATGSIAFAQLLQAGTLRPGEIQIVWETPPYVTSVWAASANLPPDLVVRIQDAFLALSPADPSHAVILESLNATGFLPAYAEDYADVTALMRRMQMVAPAGEAR